MCRKYFTNYAKSSNEFVTVSGCNRVPVAGRGSIHFTALLPNGRLNIILHDVLYIPHLGANLVSLGALHRQGVSVRSLDNSLVLSKDSEELFRASLTNSAGALYHIQCVPLAHNIAYLAKSFGSIHLRHCCMRYSHYHAINPEHHQYSVKSPEVSKKEVNQSVNDAIINDVTSSPIDFPATIENSPLLVTTPLSDIPKDSALSSVVIPPENSFPSLLKHSNCDRKLQSHLALSTVNNITTGTVNAAMIAKANELETHHEVSHSPHSKQWELAVQSLRNYINCDPSSLLMAKGRKSMGCWAKFPKGFLCKFLANFTKIPSKF